MESQLENQAWHALRGNQSSLGEHAEDGLSSRYLRDVSPFCAIATPAIEAWESLNNLVNGRAVVLVNAERLETPPGWEQVFDQSLTQYVAADVNPDPGLQVVTLGSADVGDMIELTKLTEPGPFLARTHKLGHYIGIREGGRLIAMAGERMQTEHFSEISAVCVHPEARRRGLAGALTLALVHEIRGRGQQAMLHVADGNDPAHRLYRAIGFEAHAVVHVGAWRKIRPS